MCPKKKVGTLKELRRVMNILTEPWEGTGEGWIFIENEICEYSVTQGLVGMK